jgi:Reverse transcriptase (RNA-dependent DNA polymerase)
MRDGYHQIPMKFDDRVKTSFTCRYGTFQFTVMPFGLSTAPATFQRMMNTIFFEMLDLGVLVYLDDVLIYSKTVEEHILLLDQVFALLQKHKLYLKEKKCSLFLETINFLGHVISKHGVSMESGKVSVVESWPVPETVTHV